ncbi:MAG TPA: RDD family protein [Candidatus Saccharimonadales bacterium]|nr:RDD family protein [Candidatus Saccharimonadales bacterium]
MPQNAPLSEVIPAIPEIPVLPPRPGFAGFWLRAIACFIDTIFIVAIFLIGASFFPAYFEKLLPPASASFTDFPQPAPIVIVILISLGCVYYTLFESSVWQATPGKRILRLYVTDLNGQRITIGRAFLRNIARQISGFLFIGYVMAGLTEKKQALHDMIAGCLVVRKR